MRDSVCEIFFHVAMREEKKRNQDYQGKWQAKEHQPADKPGFAPKAGFGNAKKARRKVQIRHCATPVMVTRLV